MRLTIFLLLSISFFYVIGQDVVKIDIGDKSFPGDAEVVITLKHRFQHYNSSLNSNGNTYDRSIHSPKSVNILDYSVQFSNSLKPIHIQSDCYSLFLFVSHFPALPYY